MSTRRVTPSSISSPRGQDIPPPQAILGKVSRHQYVALWTFTMVLHALCAVFLLACAKLYWLMENEYLVYFATLLAPARDRHFQAMGTFLGVLGAAHALQLLMHLGSTIIARRLRVRPMNIGSDGMSLVSLVFYVFGRFVAWVVRCWRISWHHGRRSQVRRRLTSMHREAANKDEAYRCIFAIRKTLEIATQVPNAYLYSILIARPWINHAKVALLVTNCWSALIIYRMLIRESLDRRTGSTILSTSRPLVHFLAVVVDTMLAVSTGILLPGAIFIPYALVFDFKNLDFPASILYGDRSFPDLILENRAFFAISWENAVMKSVPHLSALLCLIAIASMLDSTTEPEASFHDDCATPSLVQNNHYRKPSVLIVSYRALVKASHDVLKARLLRSVQRVVIPFLFLATGVVVLVLHFMAQFDPVYGNIDEISSFCLVRTHPWLAANVSCAVVKYNCYREGVSSPSFTALDFLEREAVRSLIFLHCPGFIMPPIIREFSYLMSVELWNTTLVSWGEEEALSATLHPRMIMMVFSFVNLTALPDGILKPPLPEQLIDLEFIHTNLTTIPDEIEDSWGNVQLLYIEHSQLNQFPDVLMRLPALAELSLIANKIETMPDDVLLTAASTYFYDLALSKNPLQKLPEARSDNFYVSYLALEFTQLTELPGWTDVNVWDSVSLGGSPFCEAANVGLPNDFLCGKDSNSWDPLGEERYPTQFVEPYRSLDS
ncbi:unnamed protein product [Phytophthora fragariaefolia]|uniref:Unnamed protein product n=1 Tax=Phytophthora fragariaefolia TaxID=1490495 RepID=A0A9W7CZS5_9STRA|nr:unnamed protein product [Phytophthora fragariaefolia]